MARIPFPNYILITRSTGGATPDDPLVWNGDRATVEGGPFRLNTGDDDILDAGVDWYGASSIIFTGHTIEVEGETFAIFSNGTNLYIPYNRADGVDLAPLANGGASTGFMADNAIVFNCFATGTRIATPPAVTIVSFPSPPKNV